ncbi:EF-hand calcium-binding domain-containing protein 6-like [Saccoglossus kowalevskii]|uniref:EF-hand calcium-binding domain-containing protein 6-like n=1 Tax=Saccoglossus kowalevskii TaxID=10224 RepID=A0ABM0M896_SACKO|nr:PREDICTED: EF-hand calcium-binding domain-containing protein 6-like [Saccoglossus kowalevskii]
MAQVMKFNQEPLALRPNTSGVVFTPKQILKTTGPNVRPSTAGRTKEHGRKTPITRASLPSSLSTYTANASLSIIELEQMLRDKIQSNYYDLKQAFQNYDIDQSLTITKGELRRVLEMFVMPFTADQFEAVMAKVPTNPNGTVSYCMFLDRYGQGSSGSKETKWMSSGHRYQYTRSPQEMGVDHIERLLKERIGTNLKNVIKAFRLFDYNRDGRIQRHEMRKVIENYCFRLSDNQFERLWGRYDFNHTGIVNYNDFLRRLGINVQKNEKSQPDTTKLAMTWRQVYEDKNKQVEKAATMNRTDDVVKGMTFSQIEHELRKRLKDNYVNLKKAFMAFDYKRDGYISIDDLKTILINFTLPMSDQLFSQLMDRFGFKASHKIPWEHFLEKFQDPRIEGNGQTIPIKWNHKVNPIRESDKKIQPNEILKLLHRHVINMYPSLKQAFLSFDDNRDGRITKSELRKIIETFTIRLTDSQFKELLLLLDPYHDNFIDYHQFLDLFEVRETDEGHKWLISEHRYNDQAKPAILAWETVEEILRKKIAEYWKSVSAAFVVVDPEKTGRISKRHLKRILENHVLPVSDDHFEKMCSLCDESEDGKIMFAEFLDRLGVDISPGDLYGTSTQIHVNSELAEVTRRADIDNRLHNVRKNALERTTQMKADEVIVRLKDRMSQHDSAIRDTFLKYCSNGKTTLTKKEFRKVLESFGMYMVDEHFNDLVLRLGFNKGQLSYSDFVLNFEDPRRAGPGEEIQRTPNHRYNKLDMQLMSALEVEAQLRDKLREGFSDLRQAFYKLDDDHNGLVRREDFRHLLDSFMFHMTDEEFNKLMGSLGIGKRTKLSYKDFLAKFQLTDNAEGHPWLNSTHRYNHIKDPTELAADQVHEILLSKAKRNYADLAKAFRSIDKRGNGVIKKRELRELLYTFMLPMTKKEFDKLWIRYDPEYKNHIDHRHFLAMMGLGMAFAPGDDEGTSRRIIEDSYQALDAHHENQVQKHRAITLNQARSSQSLTSDQLIQRLKDRFRDHYSTFQDAFQKSDKIKDGKISISELQKILVDLNYLVDDETFFEFLDKIGMPTNKTRLSYEQFLSAFDEAQEPRYKKKNKPEVTVESFSTLQPEKALKKLKRIVYSDRDVLRAAFNSFDRDHQGRLSAGEFRRILDHFCFKLTDKQFKLLMTKVKVHSDLSIDWLQFLDDFSCDDRTVAQNWLESVQKVAKDASPRPMGVDEIQMRLQEIISARFYQFAERFSEIDYAKIGVIAKDDFRDVIQDSAFRLTDSQFEKLWSTLDINKFGNLEYRKFLNKFSTTLPNGYDPPGTAMSRPSTSATMRSGSRMSRMSDLYGRRTTTPMVNAENIERKLKDKIYKYWQDIQKMCRLKDDNDSGEIDIYDFRDIMEQFQLYLPADEFQQLMQKYDLQENGKFNYNSFLRNFVLRLKPITEEESTDNTDRLLQRKQIHPTRVPMKVGVVSDNLMEAMLRVRECVVQNWKQMRRTFRAIDTTAIGTVSPLEFRSVLRQFNINLSEDEFFHLMTYYDKEMSGRVSYNDFLRAYLKP